MTYTKDKRKLYSHRYEMMYNFLTYKEDLILKKRKVENGWKN